MVIVVSDVTALSLFVNLSCCWFGRFKEIYTMSRYGWMYDRYSSKWLMFSAGLNFLDLSSKVLVQEWWCKVWIISSKSLSMMSEPANNAKFYLGCIITHNVFTEVTWQMVSMYTWTLQKYQCFTHNSFCLSHVAWNQTILGKQPSLEGPSIRIQGQLDQTQMWLLWC